ncbi:MAG: hypothetical protein JJU41_05315 [Bacteroidetes bacterium]|nr:hypothetical protein [Bacteroidota bacterium]
MLSPVWELIEIQKQGLRARRLVGPNPLLLKHQRAEYQRAEYQRGQYQRAEYQRAEYERGQYQRAEYQRGQHQRAEYQRESSFLSASRFFG